MGKISYYRYPSNKNSRGVGKWIWKIGVALIVILLLVRFFDVDLERLNLWITSPLVDFVNKYSQNNSINLVGLSLPQIEIENDIRFPSSILTGGSDFFKNKLNSSQRILNTQIAGLKWYETYEDKEEGINFKDRLKMFLEDNIEENNKTKENIRLALGDLADEVLIGIYHTHTGETYALTDGVERIDKGIGGVVSAGEALKKELEENYGIKVVHSTKINDKVYNASYAESKKDASKMLEENPNIQIILDIHRDAGKSREDSLVTINGVDLASIMFVVGSDARASFPDWEKNHQFAQKVASLMDEKYPSLCCEVRVQDGRYNQFLHPRAMLVEMGTVQNYTHEAEESAKILAEILVPILIETAQEESV